MVLGRSKEVTALKIMMNNKEKGRRIIKPWREKKRCSRRGRREGSHTAMRVEERVEAAAADDEMLLGLNVAAGRMPRLRTAAAWDERAIHIRFKVINKKKYHTKKIN